MSFDYFTLPELRALPGMDNTVKYTDARCQAAHDWIVGTVERVVGTSFIGRTVTAEKYDGGGSAILLLEPYVLSVGTVTENGDAVTETLLIRGGNVLVKVIDGSNYALSWLPGVGNVSVTYTAGYTATVPGDIKEMCLKAARLHLLSTDAGAAIDERRQQITTDQGTITYAPVDDDHPTGYPSVDVVIVGWRDRLDVLGMA